jgi:hypothetical protein
MFAAMAKRHSKVRVHRLSLKKKPKKKKKKKKKQSYSLFEYNSNKWRIGTQGGLMRKVVNGQKWYYTSINNIKHPGCKTWVIQQRKQIKSGVAGKTMRVKRKPVKKKKVKKKKVKKKKIKKRVKKKK